jgi:SET domain
MSSTEFTSSNVILQDLFGSSTDEDSNLDDEVDTKSAAETLECLSAVVEMIDVGGCRGLVALVRIPPGVLLLAETPSVMWNNSNLDDGDLEKTLQMCLSKKLAHETTKSLHPTALLNCEADEISRAQNLLGLKKINEIAEGLSVTADEVLRVLLVLQHNGFGSGLYGVLTMLNHSCSPNCIKFSPCAGSSGASEIWTIDEVQKGDELTICYCEPLEMTKESMQEYLDAHHRFTCKCPSCVQAITFRNSLPEEKLLSLRKVNLQEGKLQEIIIGMEQELLFLKNLDDLDVGFDNVVKLMKATTDLSSVESDENKDDNFSVNPRLLSRLCKLAANAAVLFLEYADKTAGSGRQPKGILIKSAAFSFLRNSLSLLSHQTKYLGNYHPDIASSHIDIAEALDCCMKNFSEDLLTALIAPVESNYGELNLLKMPRSLTKSTESPSNIKSEAIAITKQEVKKESNRLRSKGSAIKNLYSRNHYPSRLATLRNAPPGTCHWGDYIPADRGALLVNENCV